MIRNAILKINDNNYLVTGQSKTYNIFQALDVIFVSQDSKIENLLNRSNGLTLSIFTLRSSFKTKLVQIKQFECNVVFSTIYVLCKN